MTSSLRILALLAACAAPVLAQAPPVPPAPPQQPPAPQQPAGQTYDLRLQHRTKSGDATNLIERVRQRGTVIVRGKKPIEPGAPAPAPGAPEDDVLQREENDQGYEQRYSEQVQEVGADGKVTKALRTYSFVEMFPDQKADMTAAPIKVQLVRTEEGAQFTPQEGAQVPELLDQLLMMEAGSDGSNDMQRENRRRLLPEAPQAVGATWVIPIADAAQIFDMDPSELVPDKSEVTGTFEKLEKLGDAEATCVSIRMKLAFATFEGMPCPEPVLFEATIRMVLPTAQDGVASSTTLEGTLKGKASFPDDSGMPQGAQLEIDVKLDNSRVVEKAAPAAAPPG